MPKSDKIIQTSLPTPGGILHESESSRIFEELCSLISNLDEIESRMRVAFGELKREMKKLKEKIEEIREVRDELMELDEE